MAEINEVPAGPRDVSRSVVIDAPANELFAVLADPHRHGEVDGSGTVQDTVKGPQQLSEGDTFSVKMKMFGAPYRITSRVTELVPDRVVQWQHPFGHSWRWEFEPVGPDRTRVTETWLGSGNRIWPLLALARFPARNAQGIESTLRGLHDRHA